MKLSDLRPTPVGGGLRLIIEDNHTVRIKVVGLAGCFDQYDIWEFEYLTGPRRGETVKTYSLHQMYGAYDVRTGRLVPAGRRIED
jgi:hypothetical protein